MLQRIIQLLMILLLASTPLSTMAQQNNKKIEEQRRRLEQQKKELDKAKREVATLKKEKSTASQRVAALDKQMRQRSAYIAEAEAERNIVQGEINAVDASIDSLTSLLEQNCAIYSEVVRVAYRNYNQNNSSHYLFSSSSISEAARRMAELEHIADSRRALADTIAAQNEALASARATLDIRRMEIDSIRRAINSERSALQADRTAAQRAYNELSRKEKRAISNEREQEKRHAAAVAELQRLLKGNKVGASFSRDTRGLNLPVDGATLTQEGFGATITGKRGAAVKTIYEGLVQEIEYREKTNHYTVFMGYNEYLVIYTNLSSVCVKKGDVVKKDQKIGTIGKGVHANGEEYAYIRLAVYDADSRKQLIVSDFFKKK